MKVIFALAALVAVAVAAPQQKDGEAVILKQESDNTGLDSYNYAYETSNGISAEESGQLINPGTENESISAKGRFSYTGADGVVYTVEYVADDNGFQPVGAHLPQ